MKNSLTNRNGLCYDVKSMQAQHSHRGCGTMDHLQEQMIADPTLLERMNDIELETARYRGTCK
ncbi:MAG: hypothetical protein IPP29_16445 [Bacteroidetes bacterium]|nr:hypothetical protein [Bacteroidota bacterium]